MKPTIQPETGKYTQEDDNQHLNGYAGVTGIFVKIFPGVGCHLNLEKILSL